MPIEKRPSNPVPKGPPPGKPGKPHRVQDGESWESVAQKYRVPVLQLIQYNFATRDPAEVNWYLREHVGCKLPTMDQKNWRFSSTANPGVINIPQQTLVMHEIAITGDPGLNPADPKQPLQGVIKSHKFAFEREFPPKGAKPDVVEVNYIALKFKISGEGEIKQDEGFLKTSFKAGQFKAGYEKKYDDFAVGFERPGWLHRSRAGIECKQGQFRDRCRMREAGCVLRRRRAKTQAASRGVQDVTYGFQARSVPIFRRILGATILW